MKKLSTLFVLLLSATCAFGQKDLAVILQSTGLTYLEAQKSRNLLYYVINTGTENILPDDTLTLEIYSMGAPLMNGIITKPLFQDTLRPGDTLSYIPVGYTFAEGRPDSFLFCLKLKTTNNGPFESDTSNNTHCRKVFVQGQVTATGALTTEEEYSVYPNPATDHIVFRCETADITRAEIMDMMGRVCLISGNTRIPVDITALSNGVYYCRLLNSKQEAVYTSKLLINR